MVELLIGEVGNMGHILVKGVLAYLLLILLLRTVGKRTLSKMNAFDFIITIALGSTFASVITNRSIGLLEGMTALGLLIGLQYAVSFISVRSPAAQRLIKAEPALLYYEGEFMDGTMKKERILKDEIEQLARNQGHGDFRGITAVILETDGSLSVVTSDGVLVRKTGRAGSR